MPPESKIVTIVTPAYDSALYIQQAIDSVKNQTYSDWRLIVVDDRSSDATTTILDAEVAKDSRITYIQRMRNGGAAVARNDGLKLASSRFVAFLDADDVWDQHKLNQQVAFMRERDIAFSFTAYQVANEYLEPSGQIVDLNCPPVLGYEDMLRKRATLGCSTVMIDRTKIGDISMPNIRTGQDYATWLTILRGGTSAHALRSPLTTYRIREGSISRNKILKAKRQWDIYRTIEKIGLAKSALCFSHYAYRALFRN